ncbi:XdhC family protein [Temperatibacter marinus]|uniref:XdhC family protein n=1 Tax=Temperatibacter marinus TaxID=1456591 RepID=A0AA52HAA7_9PROT|nr:XdhC family protein [Temperatibacter marinus]WND03427.1 XdhC family protein [Temperatibacter marinus]
MISYDHPVDVLDFLIDQYQNGEMSALVAVIATSGGSVRSVGSIIGISDTGEMAGHISNGCVDATLILKAKEAMKAQQEMTVKFGAGSPYKDLQLPCGGSIELLIKPMPDILGLTQCRDQLNARKTTRLHVTDTYSITLSPKLKIRIVGVGAEMMALIRISRASGFDVIAQSPNDGFLKQANLLGVLKTHHLLTPDHLPGTDDDCWTAVVVMFHDHDWEPEVLAQALSGPAFYLGALGSRKTHAVRKQVLIEKGVSEKRVATIKGPIGLIPSLRDANMVALSCLAEVIQHYTQQT